MLVFDTTRPDLSPPLTAAGAPLLRPSHRRNGAYARLLDDGQKAGARRPGQGRTHQGRLVLLRHDGGGDGYPAGRGQKARGRLPQSLPRHEERREPSAGRAEGWCPPRTRRIGGSSEASTPGRRPEPPSTRHPTRSVRDEAGRV